MFTEAVLEAARQMTPLNPWELDEEEVEEDADDDMGGEHLELAAEAAENLSAVGPSLMGLAASGTEVHRHLLLLAPALSLTPVVILTPTLNLI
jgi:hypothetical protein